MSQEFKLQFDDFIENDPTGSQAKPGSYPAGSYARNLTFTWPDGRMQFLNYAYLVSAEYNPESNIITLTFTTHIVTLKGARLKNLFLELIEHLPKIIACSNERYNAIQGNDQPIINEITIAEK